MRHYLLAFTILIFAIGCGKTNTEELFKEDEVSIIDKKDDNVDADADNKKPDDNADADADKKDENADDKKPDENADADADKKDENADDKKPDDNADPDADKKDDNADDKKPDDNADAEADKKDDNADNKKPDDNADADADNKDDNADNKKPDDNADADADKKDDNADNKKPDDNADADADKKDDNADDKQEEEVVVEENKDILILNTIIKSEDQSPKNFTKKILFEEHTATWCSACPKMTKFVDELKESHPNKVYSINIHKGTKGDPYGSKASIKLVEHKAITHIPTGFANRGKRYYLGLRHEIQQDVTESLLTEQKLGIGIHTKLKANKLEAYLEYALTAQVEGELRYTIYLTESELKHKQTGLINKPIDYLYTNKDILRANLTDVFGEIIPDDKRDLNTVYKMAFEYNVSNKFNKNNCHLVVFISDKDEKIIAVQRVKLGQNQTFD